MGKILCAGKVMGTSSKTSPDPTVPVYFGWLVVWGLTAL